LIIASIGLQPPAIPKGIEDDTGRIIQDGKTLFDSTLKINVAPEARNIGYVFQNYALFPHMSIHENVAFGLRTRKILKKEIDYLVRDHLEAAGLWE